MVSIDSVIAESDPQLGLQVTNFLQAIRQLTATTLRNLIGSLDLERSLRTRIYQQAASWRAG